MPKREKKNRGKRGAVAEGTRGEGVVNMRRKKVTLLLFLVFSFCHRTKPDDCTNAFTQHNIGGI